MNNSTLLKTGVIGTIIAIVCCFTPFLVVLLTSVGLVALIGYIDLVLLPMVAIFAGITGYALWKKQQT